MKVWEILEEIKNEGPVDSCSGICNNIKSIIDNCNVHRQFEYYAPYFWEEWKHYSGNKIFPVPDPEGVQSAEYMFEYTRKHWEGKYGKLRWDLLEYLLEQFKGRNL